MTLEAPLLHPRPKPESPLGRWLDRNRYTVTDLADALGVNKATISRIARGGPCSAKLEQRIKKITGLKRL